MNIISKKVNIKKNLNNSQMEAELSVYGEPLRWAVVDVQDDNYIVEAVFIK